MDLLPVPLRSCQQQGVLRRRQHDGLDPTQDLDRLLLQSLADEGVGTQEAFSGKFPLDIAGYCKIKNSRYQIYFWGGI